MKKFLALLLVFAFVMALSACKNNDSVQTDPTLETNATTGATTPTQETVGTTEAVNTSPSEETVFTFPPDDTGDSSEEMPDVCSHMYDIDPTCTKGRTCSMCGDEKEGTELGHIWKDATDGAPKTCIRCNITEE